MEHIASLQAYVADLEAGIQKLSSRLDESNLNFKYETLIKTYNEAEAENKQLHEKLTLLTEEKEGDRARLTRLTQENGALQDKLRLLTAEQETLKQQLRDTESALLRRQMEPSASSSSPGIPSSASSASSAGLSSSAPSRNTRSKAAPSALYILQTY